MLLCPRCKRSLDGSEHVRFRAQWWGASTGQIRCARCGYRGFPIEVEAEGERPEKKRKEPDWAQMIVLFLFAVLLSAVAFLIVNGLLGR